MRQYTEKEKTALTRAFQMMMFKLNGIRLTVTTHSVHLDALLKAGLSLDEIFNTENYYRACSALKCDNICPTDIYTENILNGTVTVKPVKSENNWKYIDTIHALSELFHEFFLAMGYKGGPWSNMDTLTKLTTLIEEHSISSLLCQQTIEAAAENTGKGNEICCNDYYNELLNNSGKYDLSENPTQEEEERMRMYEQAKNTPDAEEENNGENVNRKEPNLMGTTAESNDGPQYGDEMNPSSSKNFMEEENMLGWDEDNIFQIPDELQNQEPGEDLKVITGPSPRDFKRMHLSEAIKTLQIKGFTALANLFPEDICIDEMIDRLTDGDFDKNKEDMDARLAHDTLNGELFEKYIICAGTQNISVTNEAAMGIDILCANWDMRDNKTRIQQKMRNIIYGNEEYSSDPDMLKILKAIEDMPE